MDELLMLPPQAELETKHVLKQLAKSHKALAELKGYAGRIPNAGILINAVLLNEAKDSSEIENIITTHDELFIAMAQPVSGSPAAKEVLNYKDALWYGYQTVLQKQVITTNTMIEIQQRIEKNLAGIRKLPGTVLKNDATGEVVYTPPSGEETLLALMRNLEHYINDDSDNTDPLVKLAVIHYQFESIHPFYDGNGRTGRVLNVVYLAHKQLLESPILYLSKYIIKNKDRYYRLLQQVRTEKNWQEWILYILTGIEQTAENTLQMAKSIHDMAEKTAGDIKQTVPKIYSRELVNLLFFELYTKFQPCSKNWASQEKQHRAICRCWRSKVFSHHTQSEKTKSISTPVCTTLFAALARNRHK